MRDYFLMYGEIFNVEIEELGEEDSFNFLNDFEVTRNCSVRISFGIRYLVERVFLNGKFWYGYNL